MAAPAGANGSRPPADWSATRLADIPPAIATCWKAPDGLRLFETLTVTVRFALRADGSLLGRPRVTFAAAPADTEMRRVLSRSAIEAVVACTPVRLSPSLGQAIAGRIFTIRLLYKGPRGRGA